MVRVANTVRNLTMKRIDHHNPLILRKAFYNREAFLKFDYSPNPNDMSTYFPSSGREFRYGVILFLFFLPFPNFAQEQESFSDYKKFLNRAKEDTLVPQARKKSLQIAHRLLRAAPDDSLKYAHLSQLVVISSHLQDSLLFHRLVTESHSLAYALDNPKHLGDVHWNYGAYYERRKKYDSSYVHYNSAYKYFMAARNEYYAGKMLYNMAYIAGQTYDYTGAEILLFRSIKIFERHHKYLQLYRCYNKLGNHADDMEEYDKSLAYYKEASALIPRLTNKSYYQLQHWNNLGVRLYKMQMFTEAIPYFEKALAYKEFLKQKAALYAKLLDNLAFCEVSLGNYGSVLEPMTRALAIRDSIGDRAGMVTSRWRFANYYGKMGDTLRAIAQAKRGLEKAKENHFTPEVLKALEMLAGLDRNNAVKYLEQHLQLNKSLNARDRNLRNKFTAIQYETEKYIKENERLFRQRLWISTGSLMTILILVLIYRNTRQRAKNKELLLEREQQQYTEDMFLMAMENATTLERGRNQERLRISTELHDGILARLFAVRFKWSYLRLSGNQETLLLHNNAIESLTAIETDIRNISHDLKNQLIWDEVGFRNEIENTIKERSEIGHFEFTLLYEQEEQWDALDYLYKINLCRMLDEILQNIIKHAQATQVELHFFVEKNVFNLIIRDNGKGFNKNQQKKGIGLNNLKIRAKKLQAHLQIVSQLGEGTTISVHFFKKE